MSKRYQEGVIRSILARPKELMGVIDFVDSKDFEDVNYKAVYEAMLEIYLEGGNISLPEIALKIGESGGAVNTGWLFNLEGNIGEWVQAAPPTTWAKLLKKESAKDKAVNVLKEGMNKMNEEGSNPLETMDAISTQLTDVSIEATSNQSFDIKDAVEEFKNESQKILETGGKIAAITSAYPTIDYYTQGWAPTHLITIGARTGIGKSVFAINNAIAAMAQGKTVLFFSLEMTRREVISRMVASIALIPIQKIEKAAPLTEDEIERQNHALEFIAQSNLVIDTNPYVTIEYLKRTSIKQSQSEEGLDLIIIDYLQLIANDGRGSRQEAVSEVSRSVKILAKELNVPVMVLVQLNRENRNNEDGDNTPKLHDIRESGAIAQDSNVVILIHRDMEEDAEIIEPKALFILAKNRQGESNKYISVRTRLECSLFIDENQKGQEVMKDLQQAEDNEVNFNSQAHNSPNAQEDAEFGNLFGSESNESGPLSSEYNSEEEGIDFNEDSNSSVETPEFNENESYSPERLNFEGSESPESLNFEGSESSESFDSLQFEESAESEEFDEEQPPTFDTNNDFDDGRFENEGDISIYENLGLSEDDEYGFNGNTY